MTTHAVDVVVVSVEGDRAPAVDIQQALAELGGTTRTVSVIRGPVYHIGVLVPKSITADQVAVQVSEFLLNRGHCLMSVFATTGGLAARRN